MNLKKKIVKKIYDICYFVDLNIAKQNKSRARQYAKVNSKRYAHIIETIIKYADKTDKKINILNASGIDVGHQDFSIASYLKEYTNISFSWTVFESPQSKYLNNKYFIKYCKDLNINLKLCDFSGSEINDIYGEKESVYDFIIFTEIAEHLDHTTLLKSLLSIKKVIKKTGILYVTTPNLLWITYRFFFLFGNGDAPYWGDGIEEMEKGLYGHIIYYDIHRLKKIIKNTGFEILKARTYYFGQFPVKKLIKLLVLKILSFISLFITHSKPLVLIIAKPRK